MGSRGPKPTPTVTLRNRGSWRAAARKGEPALPVCELEPPEWLPDAGKELFRELAALLFDAGVTTRGDKLALALLCKSFADFIHADEQIAEHGEVVACGNGGSKLSPWVVLRSAAQERVEKGLAAFGLTPADRARVTALPGTAREDAQLAKVLERFQREPRIRKAQ